MTDIPKFQKVPLEQLEAYVIAMNDDQGKDIEYSVRVARHLHHHMTLVSYVTSYRTQ